MSRGHHLVANLHQPATIQREEYKLADIAVAGADTTAITAARLTPFYVAVTLTGWATGAGTVVVHGTLDSAPVSASQAFTSNSHRVYMDQQFDILTSVVTTGFVGDSGQVRVDATSRTGQPDEQLTTIATNVLCKVTRERFGGLQQSVGEAPIESARIYFFTNQALKRKDIVSVDGDRWRIKGIQQSFRMIDADDHLRIALCFHENQS